MARCNALTEERAEAGASMEKNSFLRLAVRSAALKLTGAGPDTPSLKQHLRSLLPAALRASGGVSADDIARLHAASQAEKIRQLSALYEGLAARVAAAEAERDALRGKINEIEAALKTSRAGKPAASGRIWK
jgi:hypothetical protein